MVTLALTPGCPAGIGPEIFPQAIAKADLSDTTRLLWCGSAALFQKNAEASGLNFERRGQDIFLKSKSREIRIESLIPDEDDDGLAARPGVVDEDALNAQKDALVMAVELAQAKKIQGMVTGPIRKSALADVDGVRFDGQTEFLHHYLPLDDKPPLMCFAGADFLLGLASIHVPIRKVADYITSEILEAKIRRLHDAAAAYFKLPQKTPKVIVLGLNPHAGENGLIGDEEIRFIRPLVDALVREGFNIEGPVAADGFFGYLAAGPHIQAPHAVLAMYHDQGLGPYKLLSKGVGVNMTIGLSVARTSPAHGTADDLAGKHSASPASLTKALEIAEKLAQAL